MKREIAPIFITPCIILNGRSVFHKTTKKITVEAPGRLMRQLVENCDGHRNLQEIIDYLKEEWEEEGIKNIIMELHTQGVVEDGPFLSHSLWEELVENPGFFYPLLTENEVSHLAKQAIEHHRNQPSRKVYRRPYSSFSQLLEQRKSIRHFSGEPVGFENILSMLWAAYGEINKNGKSIQGRRTTPSAGGLYPLSITLVLLKPTNELEQGIYRVWMGQPNAVGFNLVSQDIRYFIRSFADPLMLENAHGVIVINGSFQITSEKYGNRALSYVLLEAGHVAQNVNLSALESNTATLEIGGFYDQMVKEATELPQDYQPLLPIVFGCEGDTSNTEGEKNSQIQVNWAVPMTGNYRLPFAMAFAHLSTEGIEVSSCGRSPSPQLAYTKAVTEAKEWAACSSTPSKTIKAWFVDLENAIDPREVIRFHPVQYRTKGFPFKSFDTKAEYEWVEGIDELQEEKVYVLNDLIHFNPNKKTRRYYRANSSGVAAHPDKQKALKNGVLELVERDAFMIAYLTRMSYPTIAEKSLPSDIQKRIKNLRKNGFEIWVKDISLDLAPVVFLFAQNKELTFTTCSACAGFNLEEITNHALMELETGVLFKLKEKNVPLDPVSPQNVLSPEDHADLYKRSYFFRKADFMALGEGNRMLFTDMGKELPNTWQSMLNQIVSHNKRLITVPLKLEGEFGGNNGLHIIRSIIPGLVPISFGYRQEPLGMKRAYKVYEKINGSSISYRHLSKFPHPFP